MDIHRCRFVPYSPSAINAVAFSHSDTQNRKNAQVRLAVGRANGDIEIWNPGEGRWHQEVVIHGGKDRSIDGLVWVTDPDETLEDGKTIPGRSRLFSIGYTTSVTEWDLENARPKRQASGQHGDIWCLAAQPAPKINAPGPISDATNQIQPVQRLVGGTVDGALVLYSVQDDDLVFQRILAKSVTKKVQMVSMAFQSRHTCVVGCSDSTIRAYNMGNTNVVRRMTLGSDLAGGSKEIIVWAVKCLPNGDIVSGDSTGQICIWDGKTYTQAQRIQSHKQDVLSLAISFDGSAITSGGMDRRTVLYKKTDGSHSHSRWAKVTHRRYHHHDVKAMASFENKKMSVVVSGGPDGAPIVVPLRELGRENHRTLSYLPQSPPLQSAPKARFVISWWERSVHIWKMRQTFSEMFNDGEVDADINNNRKLLKTIVVKGDSNITSATISQDGSLLVISTSSQIKAFHLKHQNPQRPADIIPSQVSLPPTLSKQGATKVQISPDGTWLSIIQEGSNVLVARIDGESLLSGASDITIHTPQNLRRLDRNVRRHLLLGGLGSYDRNIGHIAFSPDSKMFATADLAGYVDTWVLTSRDGQLRQRNGEGGQDNASSSSDDSSSDEEDEEVTASAAERWTRNPMARLIPKLPAAPVVLSFSNDVPASPSPNGASGGPTDEGHACCDDYTLLAITTSWSVLAFHPLRGALTGWTRRNAAARLPEELKTSKDLAMGVLWQGKRAWIYGTSFLFMLDMAQDLPIPVVAANESAAVVANGIQNGRKRKRIGPESGAGSRTAIGALVPNKILRLDQGKADGGWEELDQEFRPEGSPEDEDMDDDQASVSANGELALLRDREAGGPVSEGNENGGQRRAWWHTYKYRPILGMVPLSAPDAEQLEVVLVERPLWEVDMAERYFGKDEYER